jgi:(p)ppGpp synthase/HD superfamily hydrolase
MQSKAVERITNMRTFIKDSCDDAMTMAERELRAFFSAVAESFGMKQAKLSAEDWLRETNAMDSLPVSSREWRRVTINAAARLASRVGRGQTQLSEQMAAAS